MKTVSQTSDSAQELKYYLFSVCISEQNYKMITQIFIYKLKDIEKLKRKKKFNTVQI